MRGQRTGNNKPGLSAFKDPGTIPAKETFNVIANPEDGTSNVRARIVLGNRLVIANFYVYDLAILTARLLNEWGNIVELDSDKERNNPDRD